MCLALRLIADTLSSLLIILISLLPNSLARPNRATLCRLLVTKRCTDRTENFGGKLPVTVTAHAHPRSNPLLASVVSAMTSTTKYVTQDLRRSGSGRGAGE
ncbi:hypothetical protein F5888DRAFT_1159573 [Russula emetica]|nr:hypothetical protein F5888DRAFT_1159573 [Russula emetica]